MNLRVVKKDVAYLVDEFLSDVFISMSFNQDAAKGEKMIDLANEALDLRDEIICKINHPDGDRRSYYRNLMDETFGALDVLYDRLSEIVKSK